MARAYRREHLKHRYGITPERFSALLRETDGLCASCLQEPGVHVDHDHATGEVRGILCSHCNTGLGAFHDDPELLTAAILYLETVKPPVV